MAKRGRKPLDYKAILPELVRVLSSGATVKDTCAYLGFHQDTFYTYYKNYPEFSEAVEKAKANAKIASVAVIRKAATDNWQAAAWFLERSDPVSWGRKDMLFALGLNPGQLKELKQKADEANIDLAAVFEQMINELAHVDSDRTRQE